MCYIFYILYRLIMNLSQSSISSSEEDIENDNVNDYYMMK